MCTVYALQSDRYVGVQYQRQVEKFMDTSRDKPTGTDGSPYIWLRYTTQFSTGGRTHTIEMGIPVPVGASAELREQLIREAEMGMDQLSRRVESRVSQMLQRSSRPPETARAQETSTIRPAQAPLQDSSNRNMTGTPAASGTSSTTPAPRSTREGPQPLPLHEKQPAPTPIRQSGVVNMPVTPGVQGDANSNMKLSQFMQAIRETWGLTPKQAMDLLNVKTLNGMNYREALRQLQPLVEGSARNASNTSTPGQGKNSPVGGQPKPAEERGRPQGSPPGSTPPSPLRDERRDGVHSAQATPVVQEPAASSKPASQATPVRSARGPLAGPPNIPVIPIRDGMVHDTPRVYKFDEEDEELEEEEEEEGQEQRVIARIKLDELREVRGTSLASPGRLTVLQNVLNSQISEEQLQHLIQSAWGVSNIKKLKVDQVEALISWAKEDFFVEEVEAVLALIDEEGSNARSVW